MRTSAIGHHHGLSRACRLACRTGASCRKRDSGGTHYQPPQRERRPLQVRSL